MLTTWKFRPFFDADWPEVWTIVEDVVRAEDTFTYDPVMTESEGRSVWIEKEPGLTFVAAEGDCVTGTAKMSTNRRAPAPM